MESCNLFAGFIAAAMDDMRVCVLSVGDQTVSTPSTRGSAPFSGVACFIVTDVEAEKVSILKPFGLFCLHTDENGPEGL